MKILVLGSTGLLGSAIEKKLLSSGHHVTFAGKSQIDLMDREKTFQYFEYISPDTVILAAAVVGGVYANRKNPVKYLSENIQIYINSIDAASKIDVKTLLFVSSSVMYPEDSNSPVQVTDLLSGKLNSDTQYFAVAKIAGVKLVEANRILGKKKWVTINLSNLFGLNDNSDPETSHVIPSLIQKVQACHLDHQESIVISGSPSTRREFLHASDAAEAILHVLFNELFDESIINVGSGVSTSIAELSALVAASVGYEGDILFETEASPKSEKILDSTYILDSGWKPKVTLGEGIREILEG